MNFNSFKIKGFRENKLVSLENGNFLKKWIAKLAFKVVGDLFIYFDKIYEKKVLAPSRSSIDALSVTEGGSLSTVLLQTVVDCEIKILDV
jgi:hypothetical protein